MMQLLITMTPNRAEQFSRDRSRLDVDSLFGALSSCRLIGRPGYSMRVAIDEAEIQALREVLGPDFIVEHDYALDSFGRRVPARAQRG